jgi:hypothetical protein
MIIGAQVRTVMVKRVKVKEASLVSLIFKIF